MNRNSKLLVRLLVVANIATIFLYMFPPIVRTNRNAPLVIAYLSISAFLIYKGLKKGLRKGRLSLDKKTDVFLPTEKFTNFIFVFYGLTFLFKYAYLLGFSPMDIGGMISRLLIGVADSQLGYRMVQERAVSPVPWSFYFLISIINQLFFVYFFIVWKRLNVFKKIVGILFIGIDFFYWLGCGTNFGVISILTAMVFSILLSPLPERKRKRGGVRNTIVIGVLLASAIVFFSYTMNGRSGGDADTTLSGLMTQFQFKEDSFILKVLPESLWSTYYYIYSYCCQGYEALGSAMNLPITWTGFVGNNPSLMSLIQFLTGYNPMTNSYMVKLEAAYGIDSYVAWHSAYLWWANDFTILGTLLIVYLMSVMCGFAYVLGGEKGDVISSVVFIVLANMILFLFANNTYLSNVFYSFMLLFPYWLFTRYKKA